MSNAISNLFDVIPPPSVVEQNRELMTTTENSRVSEDAEAARSNLKKLMGVAEDALRGSLAVANSSEQPRAYEVVAALINTAAELNIRLIDTHNMEKKIRGEQTKQPSSVTNNNVVFTGTPSELLKLIKGNQS